MCKKKHYTGDQRQFPDDEFTLGDVSGGDEVSPEDRVLLHLHRSTLAFVAFPVALLVLLAAVVDASAAGALLQGVGFANCTFPTHFARENSKIAFTDGDGRCVLNKAGVLSGRDISAWSTPGWLSILGEWCASVRRGLPRRKEWALVLL